MTHTVEYILDGKKYSSRHIGEAGEIRRVLSREGKTVLRIRRCIIPAGKTTRPEEIMHMLKGLGSLLKLRVPLSSALERVTGSLPKTSGLVPIMAHVKKEVETRGKQLSRAMEPHYSVFGSTAMAMIAAGDNSGRLSESLITAAEHIKTMVRVKSGILKSLAYPILLMVASMAQVMFSAFFVIPAMTKNQKGASDTLYAKAMVAAGHLAPWFLLLFATAAGIAFLWLRQDQRRAERALFKIPGFKELIFYQSYSVAFETLSGLMSVGVQLAPALEIAARSTRLVMVRHEFQAAHKALVAGNKWASELRMLDGIERGMLDQALSESNMPGDFKEISERFYRLYVEKLESIGPRMQTIAYALVIITAILTLLSTMVPYFQSFGQLTGKGLAR